jgi:uncharacterized protein
MTFSALSLAVIAALAYFAESVFGFGGTLIFITGGAFFADFKTVLYLSIYVSFVASVCIFIKDYRYVCWAKLGRVLLMTAPGVVIGTMLIEVFSPKGLLVVFALLLIAYALQGLIRPKLVLPRSLRRSFIILGGFVQGLYSTGGPFVMMGIQAEFKNKSELRAVMAGFFMLTNLFRMGQGQAQGSGAMLVIMDHLWLAVPVVIAVKIGHYVHNMISEQSFRKGVLILILCAGLAMITKSIL